MTVFKLRSAVCAFACLCVAGSLLFHASAPGLAFAASSCTPPRADLTPDSEEAAMIGRINDYRAQSGLGKLAVSRTLMAAAAWKSNDLGVHNYFGHDDLDRSYSQRFLDCGYNSSQVSENLAAGKADAASTFEQWRTSAAHNANLLDASFSAKVIGVARARVAGSAYGWYWTADFGGVADGFSGPGSASSAAATTSLHTILAAGSTAVVAGTGPADCLRVHAAAGSASAVVACLPDGAAMIVTDGPILADGYVWLRLGNLGWAVSDYLTPPTT